LVEGEEIAGMVKAALDWLQHNKEWVFSGCGLVAISGIVALFRWLFSRPVADAQAAVGPPPSALRVNLGFGAFTYYGPPWLGDQMLMLKVANANDRPIKLSNIRLSLKGGANMFFPGLAGERRLPCMIDPGIDVKFWVPVNDVETSLRARNYRGTLEIHVVASDALDNEYASNSVALPLAS
jgi:hypothetical protein